MKKLILTVSAFAVFAGSAFAYQATNVEVKVPFAFKAGDTTLPAGTYYVTKIAEGCILIKGEKSGVFAPGAMSFDATSGKVSLKFDRAGDKYVLQSAGMR